MILLTKFFIHINNRISKLYILFSTQMISPPPFGGGVGLLCVSVYFPDPARRRFFPHLLSHSAHRLLRSNLP